MVILVNNGQKLNECMQNIHAWTFIIKNEVT